MCSTTTPELKVIYSIKQKLRTSLLQLFYKPYSSFKKDSLATIYEVIKTPQDSPYSCTGRERSLGLTTRLRANGSLYLNILIHDSTVLTRQPMHERTLHTCAACRPRRLTGSGGGGFTAADSRTSFR